MAQLNPTLGDLAGNRAKAQAAHREGAAAGADFVALPEMFLVGYQPRDLVLKLAFVADCRTELDRLAADCADGPPLGIGLPLAEGRAVHNVYAILEGGQDAGYARKHHLPNYNEKPPSAELRPDQRDEDGLPPLRGARPDPRAADRG